jgi:hypothetical protein
VLLLLLVLLLLGAGTGQSVATVVLSCVQEWQGKWFMCSPCCCEDIGKAIRPRRSGGSQVSRAT